MVGTSKILTVSYGTFSCTLEGFDDSFNTMKAIAEYFRGLAADDRYFGAEPPTPDAEMLARIAEREIERRVEAHMGEKGIILRAAALTDQTGIVATAASKAEDEDAAQESQAAAEAAAADEAARIEAQVQAKAAQAQALAQAQAEAAAAQAKAKAEARAQAELEAQAEQEAQAKAKAKADAEAKAQVEAVEAEAALLSTVARASQTETPFDTVDTTPQDATSTSPEVETQGETQGAAQSEAQIPNATVPAHNDTQSVAAKLQRIRAVVTRNDKSNANDATLPPSEPDLLTQAPNLAAADGAQPSPAPQDLKQDQNRGAEMESDMISRVMARHAATATATAVSGVEPSGAMPQADTTPLVQTAETSDTLASRVRVVRMKRADFENAVASDTADLGEVSNQTPQVTLEPATDKAQTPDLGMLDGADELDTYLEDSDFDAIGFDDSDLSFDADIHLNETDDLDDADDTDDDQLNVFVQDAQHGAPAAQTPKTTNPQVDEAALNRLLSEADTQMKEPESSRRRDAIAQLKAAVAAKEAARQIGEPDEEDHDVENAFREDLSKAVRPEQPDMSNANQPLSRVEARPLARPVARTEGRTERPRPAPLKLVAAQRVDLPAGADARREGPVVPRRVAAPDADAANTTTAGSFAAFAEDMGATSLPDLLEAAAAYTAFVEGAEEFSRPQILRRVRAVTADEYHREDGLRSFTDLLRAGRFTKVRNGRFQVADDTRFNPARRAG